jgi:hypothetical protein
VTARPAPHSLTCTYWLGVLLATASLASWIVFMAAMMQACEVEWARVCAGVERAFMHKTAGYMEPFGKGDKMLSNRRSLHNSRATSCDG